jgi:hypothetical protein
LWRDADPAIVRVMDRETCSACHSVPNGCGLRRGLCRACYLRAWRGTELPVGATCATCAEKRRIMLRWTKVGVEKVVTCQNCGFVADKARPRPHDLEELRLRLARERRGWDRRRNYVVDLDDPSERRQRARRLRRRAAL